MWVRGLKLLQSLRLYQAIRSHPMWVRGLKQLMQRTAYHINVASYVGAWIETS